MEHAGQSLSHESTLVTLYQQTTQQQQDESLRYMLSPQHFHEILRRPERGNGDPLSGFGPVAWIQTMIQGGYFEMHGRYVDMNHFDEEAHPSSRAIRESPQLAGREGDSVFTFEFCRAVLDWKLCGINVNFSLIHPN